MWVPASVQHARSPCKRFGGEHMLLSCSVRGLVRLQRDCLLLRQFVR